MSSALKHQIAPIAEPPLAEDEAAPGGAEVANCVATRDLYGPTARQLIGRALADYLEAAKITPVELMYSVKHQTALQGAGTILLQAIQRTAALQVRGTDRGVGERIKELFKLVDGVLPRTREILAQPKPLGSGLLSLSALIAEAPEAERDDVVQAAIAAQLEGTRSWAEKIDRLVRLSEGALTEPAALIIDACLAEVLRFKAVLEAIIGPAARGEGRIQLLAELIGSSSADTARHQPTLHQPTLLPPTPLTDVGRALAGLLSSQPCPISRDALADHLADLLDRIPAGSALPADEFAVLGRVCRSLRHTKHWPWSRPLVVALERRFARVVTSESVPDLVGPMPDGCTEAERLIDIHDDIVGAGPRNILVSHLDDRLSQSRIKTQLAPPSRGPVAHLRAMARVHQRIQRSAIESGRRTRLCARLEQAQDDLVRTNNLIAHMEQQGSCADKALALLDLCRADVLVAKTMRSWVKRQAVGYMQRPEFLVSFLQGANNEPEKTKRLLVLQQRLAEAGMVDKSAVI